MKDTFRSVLPVLFCSLFLVSQVSARPWLQAGPDIVGERREERSGSSVSLSADGTRLAIGAPGGPSGSGLVRVFEYAAGSWVQLGTDIDDEVTAANSGRSVSLSADGTRVAIGAPDNYATNQNDGPGHVRIFEYLEGSWIQLGEDIDGEAAYDLSGTSVSLSADGSRVAVGATGNDGNGTFAGNVRIFEYTGGSWVKLGTDIDGEASEDFCGRSVSLSADGSRVAVGADGNDDNGTDSGHVRIFEYSGGSWVQVGVDIDGHSGDQSGWTVSLSANGSRVAIGGYGYFWGSGLVHIFEYSGGSWVQVGANIGGESASLSADGSRVAIRDQYIASNGDNTSYARIFEYSEGEWVQLGADIDGERGEPVSLSADGMRIAVGVPLSNLVRVFFDKAIVDLSTIGNGIINPSSGLYPTGTNLVLSAIPDVGWLFMGWSGDLFGDYTTAVTNLVVDSDKSITGTFSNDADNDGILNTNETVLGTNPRLSDSDYDGLSDYQEVYTYTTDPLLFDMDGDGLSDGQEVLTYGSDPKLIDTDQDGFDDGYEVSTGYDPTSTNSTPELYSTIKTSIQFEFNAASGQVYRIEGTPALTSPWASVENSIPGAGGLITRHYDIDIQSNKFFRAKRD